MPETVTTELLTRYLRGTATEAERHAVAAWAALAPANHRELERLRAVLTPQPTGDWDVEQAWRQVAARLDQPAPPLEHSPARLGRRGWLALAAAVTITVAAAWLWTVRVAPVGERSLVVVTGPGEQETVNLPDGSRVVVAPASRLEVVDDAGRGPRQVRLAGEAWFEVAADPDRPFLVHAAGTITEVLGTSFLVQELPGGGVRVALVTGRTSLRRAAAPAAEVVTLDPGDLAVLAPDAAVATVTHAAEFGALLAWRDGRLDFDDAPLGEVRDALARWYGVTVVLADPALAARRFTGTFRLGELDDALDVLALSLGVHAERRADSVIVQ